LHDKAGLSLTRVILNAIINRQQVPDLETTPERYMVAKKSKPPQNYRQIVLILPTANEVRFSKNECLASDMLLLFSC